MQLWYVRRVSILLTFLSLCRSASRDTTGSELCGEVHILCDRNSFSRGVSGYAQASLSRPFNGRYIHEKKICVFSLRQKKKKSVFKF